MKRSGLFVLWFYSFASMHVMQKDADIPDEIETQQLATEASMQIQQAILLVQNNISQVQQNIRDVQQSVQRARQNKNAKEIAQQATEAE